MESSLVQLKQLACAIEPLSEEAWIDFAFHWQPFSVKRKEVITAPGETEQYLYFVTGGVQRVFYEDDQDHEATLVFTYAPSFGGVLDSLMLKQPSRYFYESLTPSSFLRIRAERLDEVMNKHRSVEVLVRKGITAATSGVLERLTELQSFSSGERFRKLLTRSPHILQLVPHKYLANYLGIDATNFSKLLNRTKV